jgi:phage antirepressor YoqD-like protein
MTALSILGTSAQSLLTMSSREIADLTGKDHSNVMRDIRHMLDALKKDALSFEGIYQDAYGREKPCFNLDRELTMTLVSGYDIQLRHRVVTRLSELESQQQPTSLNPANLSRLQLIELAMQAEQERIESEQRRAELEVKVEAMAPQVQALERIAKSDGSLCLTDAAKTLQIQLKHLTQFLHANHWIYRRPLGIGWIAYQDKIQTGHLEHKVTTGEKSDGSEWTNTQVRITPKGLPRLAALLAQPKAIAA